eukprot:gene2482-3191_t
MEKFLNQISKDYQIKEKKPTTNNLFLQKLEEIKLKKEEKNEIENKITILNNYLKYLIEEKENIQNKKKQKNFIYFEKEDQNEFISFLENDFEFLNKNNEELKKEFSISKIERVFYQISRSSTIFQEYQESLIQMKKLTE